MNLQELAKVNLDTVPTHSAWKDLGWWDWHCTEQSLKRRAGPFVKLAQSLGKSAGERRFFLKNNQPCNGQSYDSMGIMSVNDDQDQEFWVEKRAGSPWTVFSKVDRFESVVHECKTVAQLGKWLVENM